VPTPDLVAAIRAADAAGGLFAGDETVVVGVSGGPDSLALLHALRAYAPERALRLQVAHLDHMLRPESTADAAFVAQLAADWGLPAALGARDVAALAADRGRGLEDAAREARYAFLAAVAADAGAARVAVAHQADDQAETVLMNIVRGTGLAGLRGMAPLAGWPVSARTIAELTDRPAPASRPWPPRVVRPFLAVTRLEVLAYLRGHGLEARGDVTNRDPSFLRNRLRHDVMPLLESINPRVREALLRLAATAADEMAFLEAAVDRAWPSVVAEEDPPLRIALSGWRAQPPAVQRHLLRRALSRLGPAERDVGWDGIEATRRLIDAGPPGASLSLPGGVRLVRGYEHAELDVGQRALPPLRLSEEPIPLVVPGDLALPGGWHVSALARDRRPDDLPTAGDGWTALLDADVVGPRLGVRSRRPGDRFRPLGMAGHHKSLQDLFVDARVDRQAREGWPLLVKLPEDAILWVPGQRLDEAARLRPEARHLLVVTVHPPPRPGR
jgi:tRNA(Ile)-lysidine synthase